MRNQAHPHARQVMNNTDMTYSTSPFLVYLILTCAKKFVSSICNKKQKILQKKFDKKCFTTKLQKSRRRSHAIFANTRTRKKYDGPAGMMPAGMGTPGLQTAKRTRYSLQGAPGPSPPTGVRPRHYKEWKACRYRPIREAYENQKAWTNRGYMQ